MFFGVCVCVCDGEAGSKTEGEIIYQNQGKQEEERRESQGRAEKKSWQGKCHRRGTRLAAAYNLLSRSYNELDIRQELWGHKTAFF